MMHFNINQIKSYIENFTDEYNRIEIEEHLEECEDCLNSYLTLIQELDDSLECSLTSDFTDNLIKVLPSEQMKGNPVKQGKRQQVMFLYYAAAACVTILLTFNGVFERISMDITKQTHDMVNTREKVGETLTNGWSERLTNKTSMFSNIINK